MVPGNKAKNYQRSFKMAAKSKMAANIYVVIFIFNFWHYSPRIYCNNSFLTNLGTLITLKWVIVRFKLI